MGYIDWGVQAAQLVNDWSSVRERVEKGDGDLSYTDVNTNGGLMSPDDADTFWRENIKVSKLVSLGTRVKMKSNVKNCPIVGISSTRISHPHSPGTALPQAQRSKPDTDNVQLSAKYFQAEISIPDDVVHDNIEGEAFKNLCWDLARKKIMSEIELYGLNSDTTATDADFASFDGVIKSISTYTVDFGGAGITRTQLKAMLATMPVENKADRMNLKFITSCNAYEHYADQLLQTAYEIMAAGYVANKKMPPPGYLESAVLDLPVMPENIGTGSNKTVVLYGNPKGIYWGFHRDVEVEFDRDKRAKTTTGIFTYRFDCKPALETQWVKGYDVAPTP